MLMLPYASARSLVIPIYNTRLRLAMMYTKKFACRGIRVEILRLRSGSQKGQLRTTSARSQRFRVCGETE